MNAKVSSEHTSRRAVVYVRQSSALQVSRNLESQRLQYGLVDLARTHGFAEVDVIDDDLGRSGSGSAERPGFERLVAAVCKAEVGAVLCLEASRLARNGRDWHHLVDLCGLVGALIIDPEGVYDPRLINDRLLLGLKGSMSEFELSLLRQRSKEARDAKASRGELRFHLPAGLCWGPSGRIELEPDQRVQGTIRLVFRRFTELGSARQVFLWMRSEEIQIPVARVNQGRAAYWRFPDYSNIILILKNPLFAGAYVYGRRQSQTRVVDGRARKTQGHPKPREQWSVLLPDHHEGYISWEEYERNQVLLEENAHMKQRMGRKSGRGGQALLTGLLRCARCGRKLLVHYTKKRYVRYHCRSGNINQSTPRCISFGGQRPERAVVGELVRALEPSAIDAAIEVAAQGATQAADRRNAIELELKQANYEALLASRRYEAVDPDNRLVASELEARWNAALQRTRELERTLEGARVAESRVNAPDRVTLMALAANLEEVWNAPSTDMKLKQRIVRILLHEIVVDVDEERSELKLVFHWTGGRHSELRVPKKGYNTTMTDLKVVEVVRRMAGRWTDEQIAATLNRLALRTGRGNAWNAKRVESLRC